MATDIGAKSIDTCVDEKTYRPTSSTTTLEAAAIGVTGTPTVFVDGKQWGKGESAQTQFDEFLQAAIDAKAVSSRPATAPVKARSRIRPGRAFRFPAQPAARRVFTTGRPWANLI